MTRPLPRQQLIEAAQNMLSQFEPDELDGLATVAIRLAVEKRQSAAHQARDFLREVERLPPHAIDFKTLLRVVVTVTDQSRDDVLRSRCPGPAKARQILFWLCATYTKLSTPQIGSLAGRDHSTVLYCIGRAQAAREVEGLSTRANPVAWANVLWLAEWPAPYAPDGGRLPRRRPASVRPCA